MSEEYRGKKNKKPKIIEDPDSLKVRLNRLIRLTEIIVWLVAIGCAIIFGIFILIDDHYKFKGILKVWPGMKDWQNGLKISNETIEDNLY